MNDNPFWWNKDITVYNKYEDPQTHVVQWYKTQLSKCFWSNRGQRLTLGDTVIETGSIICRIPKDDTFLEKYLWVQLPNDEMGKHFTLGKGDILVKGHVDDVIDEYTKGSRATDLIAKYSDLQGCMQINEITINTGAGLNNEHYLVRGM